MSLTWFGLLWLLPVALLFATGWFLKYGHRYFGTDRRNKHFADYYKDFPIFHNSKTLPYKRELFKMLPELESSFPGLRTEKGIRILEIGAGSGANLEFYPENTKLIALDRNPFFKEHLVENVKKFPKVELERYVVSGAEDMTAIPSNSVDAVVSTVVLCSVSDIQQVCKEICRVLVPGGKYFMMDHVIDDKLSLVRIFQRVLGVTGLNQFFNAGCRPDKDILKELSKAGTFASTDFKRFWLDISEVPPGYSRTVYLVRPHIYGIATTTTKHNNHVLIN